MIMDRFSLRPLTMVGTALLISSAVVAAPMSGTYSSPAKDEEGLLVPGFYPNVEVDLMYDDNVLRTQAATRGSMIGKIKPQLLWTGKLDGATEVNLGYQGEYANYFDEPTEDYDDHMFGGDITFQMSQLLSLSLGANYRFAHETRDASTSILGASPNEWEQWAIAGEAIYGRRTQTMQIGARVEHADRSFTNNAQSVRDYESDSLTLAVYYNLGPRTQLLVEPSVTEFTYPNSAQDNSVQKILAGVTWTATAKTTGKFKIGYEQKDFDSAAFADESGLSLDTEIIWLPKTYSRVTFRASRSLADSSLAGTSSYATSKTSADWAHDLTALTQLQVGAAYLEDDYGVLRKDETYNVYVGLSHALKRWLTVGARYDFTTRDSSAVGADYDSNVFTLGLKTTFN